MRVILTQIASASTPPSLQETSSPEIALLGSREEIPSSVVLTGEARGIATHQPR